MCYRIQTTASTALSNIGYAFIELDMPQSWHWYAYAELVISFFLSCCNRRKKKNQTLGQGRQKSFQQVNEQMKQMKTQLVLPEAVEMVVDLSTVGVRMLDRLDSYFSVVQKKEPSLNFVPVASWHKAPKFLFPSNSTHSGSYGKCYTGQVRMKRTGVLAV
ncbi:hypothetical protein BHM03_00022250 [Ensete ventricosum]|nr:hypothetical protein BHM03_00022250 [Ensete ventricosum]